MRSTHSDNAQGYESAVDAAWFDAGQVMTFQIDVIDSSLRRKPLVSLQPQQPEGPARTRN